MQKTSDGHRRVRSRSKDIKATEHIQIRLTPEEKKEIELLAKESNLKMSEFIRRQVFRSEKFREMLTTVVKAIEKDTTKNDYKFTEEN